MIYSAGSDWVTRELSPGHTPCPLHGLSRGETILLEYHLPRPKSLAGGDAVDGDVCRLDDVIGYDD